MFSCKSIKNVYMCFLLLSIHYFSFIAFSYLKAWLLITWYSVANRKKHTGFRSQWMIRSRCNILRHCRREKANLRIKAMLNPWKLFFLINSYRFILKRNSNPTFIIHSFNQTQYIIKTSEQKWNQYIDVLFCLALATVILPYP